KPLPDLKELKLCSDHRSDRDRVLPGSIRRIQFDFVRCSAIVAQRDLPQAWPEVDSESIPIREEEPRQIEHDTDHDGERATPRDQWDEVRDQYETEYSGSWFVASVRDNFHGWLVASNSL